MAAVRISSPEHLFDDATYHSIRSDLIPELYLLGPTIEGASFASILENWAYLCSLFQRHSVQLIHEKIVAWTPEHPETQKVKALWMQVSAAFQHPEKNLREHMITNLFIFLGYVSSHMQAERQLLFSEESDSKQNDSEPSASSVADQHPSASAVIFEDASYASIRQNFFELPLKAALKTPIALESWPALRSLFQGLDIEPLHKQFAAWNPEHTETQRVKALWMYIFTALDHPEEDRREHVIAIFVLLIALMAEHSALEETSRALSPVPDGAAAPPSSPEEPVNKKSIVNDLTD